MRAAGKPREQRARARRTNPDPAMFGMDIEFAHLENPVFTLANQSEPSDLRLPFDPKRPTLGLHPIGIEVPIRKDAVNGAAPPPTFDSSARYFWSESQSAHLSDSATGLIPRVFICLPEYCRAARMRRRTRPARNACLLRRCRSASALEFCLRFSRSRAGAR